MPNPKVLCVHGIGDHHSSLSWQTDWRDAIERSLGEWTPGLTAECEYLMYDDIFEKYDLDPVTYSEAVARLLGSGIGVLIGNVVDDVGDLFRLSRARGIEDIPTVLRWTAGMVAQWASHEMLRKECRARVQKWVRDFQPDVILAHSLGTLVCYDTFVRDHHLGLLKGRRLVTFGSQIATPYVRGTFGGRIVQLRDPARWYQLFNPNDKAFTAPIKLNAPNFTRVNTAFTDGYINHDGVHYITHDAAINSVWREVAAPPTRGLAAVAARLDRAPRRPRPRRGRSPELNRRALLVAINEYPDPGMRLEGCVNDAFLMSAALQESGFAPEQIRTVFDDRATAANVLERLHWLLDDTEPGDQRVLFYSGHGAQIPQYGPRTEVDHFQESLVPYDFDWSPQRAVTDEAFANLYSQLPYDATFVAILDCCHSGGLTPPQDGAGAGGDRRGKAAAAAGARAATARVRGILPPDDIRHRALRWNAELEMWEPRPLPDATPDRSVTAGDRREAFVGASGASFRFGRAVELRRLTEAKKKREYEELDHRGPFVPMVLQACRESELAYEYRHGVTSYGAFTYCLYHILRNARRGGGRMTFQQLAEQTSRRLRERLGYDQTPCLFGPTALIKRQIPWFASGSAGAKTG